MRNHLIQRLIDIWFFIVWSGMIQHITCFNLIYWSFPGFELRVSCCTCMKLIVLYCARNSFNSFVYDAMDKKENHNFLYRWILRCGYEKFMKHKWIRQSEYLKLKMEFLE